MEQAQLAAELKSRGARRRKALSTAEEELAAIAELLPKALESGLTKASIARLTGLGRPTIDGILLRRKGSH